MLIQKRMAAMAVAGLFSVFSSVAQAQDPVQVGEPWVRATVAGQKATGAFMTLKTNADWRLIAADSSIAGVTQVHQMSMKGGVMRMSEVEGGLALPAGETVTLKPGGYHIMLMDLKQPVQAGDAVDLTLTLRATDGRQHTVSVQAPAVSLGSAAGAGKHGHTMGGHKHAD